MTSLQDRHSFNRFQLEKWTVREQLCLASAVSCSGDQNWMSVSRALKQLCGANRPPDWFSQKHCAVKYGELLENVETPKRKKRTTSDTTTCIVETPTDLILRRLTEERIQELKSEIRQQQETYAKLYTDVVHLQTGNSNEEQIRAMWIEVEREQELDRQLKMRNQIGASDTQRNIRQQQQITPVKQEQDMDIDETCNAPGTSPLLSSLLKSTSPPIGTTSTLSAARASAPTITNLLTGGTLSCVTTLSSSLQTSGMLAQSIPLSKPLTGPGPVDNIQSSSQIILSPSQSAPTLSMLLEKTKAPKENAQTLSQQGKMNEQINDEVQINNTVVSDVNSLEDIKNEAEPMIDDEVVEDGTMTPTKEEEQQLLEVFKNLMPENIEDLADILTNNNGILNPAILEEESILEGDEPLIDTPQAIDIQVEEKQVTSEFNEDLQKLEDSESTIKNTVKTKTTPEMSPINQLDLNKSFDNPIEIVEEEKTLTQDEVETKEEMEKIETISSDDSSDNIPLSAHTKEEKTSITTSDLKTESINIDTVETVALEQSPVVLDTEESQSEQEVSEKVLNTNKEKEIPNEFTINEDEDGSPKNDLTSRSERRCSLSDSSDVIIIPTDDESNEGKEEVDFNKSRESNETLAHISTKRISDVKEEDEEDISKSISVPQENASLQEPEITSICLPDTDDDSSTLEVLQSVSKEDKQDFQKQSVEVKKQEAEAKVEDEVKQTLAIRKLRDRDRSESPLVEDDNSDHSITVRSRRRCSSTPVIESIPNSPASSDDREFKAWKKTLMAVYNNLLNNKNASIFLRPITDEQNPLFRQVCRRPMDLQIIKRHIENGTIRNVNDFQRDVFLMCQNVIMAFKNNSLYVNMARGLMSEFVQIKEQVVDPKLEKFSSSSCTPGVKIRGSSRKSQRLP